MANELIYCKQRLEYIEREIAETKKHISMYTSFLEEKCEVRDNLLKRINELESEE